MAEAGKGQFGVQTPDDDRKAELDAANEKKKVFANRDEVEQKGLFYKGRTVKFKDTVWRGKDEIFVPKWNMDTSLELGKTITWIVATLFPKDWFFLATIDTTKVATAASKIYDIVYEQVYPQAATIVQRTLRSEKYPELRYHVPMEDDEWAELRRSMSPLDFLEVFVVIVEQEINNEVMQALSKKLTRLLGEKFQLENAFPNISELMGELSDNLLENIRLSSSPSSTNTPQ